MIHDVPTNAWDLELEELFLQTGARFCRVEARRRMRDYVRGLLGPVGRKNSPPAGSGAKGERFYDWAAARLPAATESDGDEPTRQRWMLARRSIGRPDEIAYYLACTPLEATVADLVRVAGSRWKIEECFQSAKNECGLDQYEVRRYVGWYRHITLAMLAHAFLGECPVDGGSGD